MMGKLPLGVASPYVKMSSGGCTDPLKFYATSYCTAYGREDFQPRAGSHRSTGYRTNLQPLVSALDDPASGERRLETSQTLTSRSYAPLELPDGRSPLPCSVHQVPSSFSRGTVRSTPSSKEVRKVHFDTQDCGAQSITGLEPKDALLLQRSQGPLGREKARHCSAFLFQGSRFMVSEYNSKYTKESPSQSEASADLLQKKCIGPKEESGFTEHSTMSPLTALPGDSVLVPSRSVTKLDFAPINYPRGSELLPLLPRGTERESGFSRPSVRNFSPPASAPAPEPRSSRQFQVPQRLQQTNVGLLGLDPTGIKEPSGYTLNNPSYVRSLQNSSAENHYLTTYKQGYLENTPKGLDREGWTRGCIQPGKPSGYALSQPVTRLEGVPSPEEGLRRLHPRMGRTLVATDPIYQAPTHSNHFTAPN